MDSKQWITLHRPRLHSEHHRDVPISLPLILQNDGVTLNPLFCCPFQSWTHKQSLFLLNSESRAARRIGTADFILFYLKKSRSRSIPREHFQMSKAKRNSRFVFSAPVPDGISGCSVFMGQQRHDSSDKLRQLYVHRDKISSRPAEVFCQRIFFFFFFLLKLQQH